VPIFSIGGCGSFSFQESTGKFLPLLITGFLKREFPFKLASSHFHQFTCGQSLTQFCS
jgi:hypothetical protein